MILSRAFLFFVLSFAAGLSHAAGFSFIEIPADQDGPALHGAVWSPCSAPARRITLTPLVIEGVKDCAISGSRLPLVLISHGTGGSFLGHHDTAASLADAGFVVASINHPGDNFQDLSQQAHLASFSTRVVDMKRLIDYLLLRWPGHARLDVGRIGLFGFSRGGYTALAAIGALPNWTLRQDLCPQGSSVALCQEIRSGQLPPAPVRDSRIKAAVVVDPLSVFDAQGLKNVDVPIQLWASAYGGDGVTPASVAALRGQLPVAPDWHVVANAAHFAFLAPCSSSMASAMPAICRDGPDFDRVAFHLSFNAEVLGFFAQHLAPGSAP